MPLFAAIDFANIVQNVLDGLSLGSLYALFALGIALIFGIMRLVNFAHGELIMIGGFLLFALDRVALLPRIGIVLIAVIVAALLVERIAFRPVRGADAATLLVTSFALSFLLQNLAIVLLGSEPRSTNVSTTLTQSFSIGSITIAKLDVVTLVTTLLLLGGLLLFMQRTRLGVQMRAAAEDFSTTLLMGVRANAVIAAAFALSGLLSGVAAVLVVAQTGTIVPDMGSTPILFAFVATTIGGMGSLVGAVAGGYLVGGVTTLLQVLLPLSLRPYRDAFVFAFVLAIFVLRPQGLVVRRSALRVDATQAALFTAGAAGRRRLRSNGDATTPLLLAAIVALVAWLGSGGSITMHADTTTFLVTLTMVVGLYIFVGNSGIFSFGHAAFMAIGAYATAILVMPVVNKQALFSAMPGVLQNLHAPPTLALLIGGLAAALFAAVAAVPLMRLGGLTASLGTFALLVIVYTVTRNWAAVTNGSAGMSGIPISIDTGTALLWAIGAIVLAAAFQHTRTCMRLRAAREDETAARSLGVTPARDRFAAFVLSAFVAGVGGGLFALQIGSIQPGSFYIPITFTITAMLVVGGATSLTGAVVGGIALSVLGYLLRGIEDGTTIFGLSLHAPSGVTEVGSALVMILILVWRPAGIVGGRELVAPRTLLRRLRPRRLLAAERGEARS